ncbi:hypothetical protein ZWY2020_021682 [Hordeum vulgare]|nr:hypothetical protein ZWY2020_021682 [Hordeum vulgare]
MTLVRRADLQWEEATTHPAGFCLSNKDLPGNCAVYSECCRGGTDGARAAARRAGRGVVTTRLPKQGGRQLREVKGESPAA